MTKTARTSLKLGLFVVIAVASVVGTALGLGLRVGRGTEAVYHTYFDESVQGLEVGAPVKYRGLPVGRVSASEIAPDLRHVHVTMSLDRPITVPRELRAQLGTQGITGVKLVNLDWFDPAQSPVTPLPFPVPRDTIPAAMSLMGGLEISVGRTLERLPAILEAMHGTLQQIERAFASFDREHLPESIAQTVANTNGAVNDIRAVLRQVAVAEIPGRTARAVDDADLAMVKLGLVLDHLGGDAGLVASTKSAADSVDELGRRVASSTDDLDRTLRDIREAARAVRELADAVERDPDMLVKGRAPRRTR